MNTLYSKYLASSGVCTDTRKIQPECIFFALKGANFNGNTFAKQALTQGAKYVVIDEVHFPADFLVENAEKIIQVADVLTVLQDLANHHRRQLNIPFIGVGGSNGKTTTKELIGAVLRKKYKTFATQGNLNNHIGVPLTLLSITQEIEMAVIELGANHEGEIAELCRIAEPNFGIITNIGLDHLEGFGSIAGVARANGELFCHLAQNQGVAFVNTQEDYVADLAKEVPTVITYPQKGGFYEAEMIDERLFVALRTSKGEKVESQLFGAYNFHNIATALCIGQYFGVPEALAHQAIANYIPANNRSQLIQKGTNTILMDAYNANPSSMSLAIENFTNLKAEHKMVILGDMYELGDASTAEHHRLGDLVAKGGFEIVVLFGKAMQEALIANPKAYYFTDKFSLHNWLQDRRLQDTYILIKGSRGVALETVFHFI
jgi:UDP-N-acetylmuramoyl-tripeptide--D-alanyl-D-alanine ligase